MQLKDIKKEGIFTTLYYELTWKIGWEQLLSILDVVIRTDFQEKGFQSLAVGMIAAERPLRSTGNTNPHKSSRTSVTTRA